MSLSKNVLVIGANRGIGLALLKTFVQHGWRATGTVRPRTIDDPSVGDLKATGAKILEADYTDEDTIKAAAGNYGSDSIDCLINCGGVGPQPFPWDADDGDRIREMFNIMAIGPYLVIKHFLPNLKKSQEPKIIQISSEFGCVTGNERGGFLGYRMAKASLNQMNKTIAQAFKHDPAMIFLCLEPGYVATRLTSWKGEDDINESVKGMYAVIEKAKQPDSGLFFDYHGNQLQF